MFLGSLITLYALCVFLLGNPVSTGVESSMRVDFVRVNIVRFGGFDLVKGDDRLFLADVLRNEAWMSSFYYFT